MPERMILREMFTHFSFATGPFAHRKALLDLYKPKAWRSQSTSAEIRSAFNRISRLPRVGATMGDADIRELKKRDFTVIRESLINGGFALKTINTTLSRLREFLTICCKLDLVEVEVVTMVNMCADNVRQDEQGVKKKNRILSVPFEHIEATIDAAPVLTATLIEVLMHTGMRPSEAAAMRVCDVEFYREVEGVKIWRYMPHTWKTDHVDEVAKAIRVGPLAMRALNRRMGELMDVPPLFAEVAPPPAWGDPSATMFVFPWGHRSGGAGGKIDLDSAVETMRDRIQRAATKAGVPRWSTNQLRHYAATKADRETNSKIASGLLGHAGERLTERVYIDPRTPPKPEVDAYVAQFC